MTTRAFSLEELTERDSTKIVPVRLPLEVINVLSQIRLSMNDIEDLSSSIANKGQLVQGIAAALTPRQARAYLKELNLVHDSNHTMKELVALKIDGAKYYILLVAGHRRYNSVLLAVKNKAKHTPLFDGLYRADLHFGLGVKDAMSIQFQENRHKQVPVLEEADAAFRFWRYQRRQNPKLTMKTFGKTIGRSTSWIKNAMRFCSLPEALQELAASKEMTIPYGILTEAARLAEGMEELNQPMDDAAVTHFVMRAVMSQETVVQVKKGVSSRLEHLRDGQKNLFTLAPEKPRPVRQIVAPQMVNGLWTFENYLKQLESLRQKGHLGKESYIAPETDSDQLNRYSPGSPIKLSTGLVELFSGMLPHLVQLAEEEGMRGQAEALSEGAEALSQAGSALAVLSASEVLAANK